MVLNGDIRHHCGFLHHPVADTSYAEIAVAAASEDRGAGDVYDGGCVSFSILPTSVRQD